jgi:hypothetical protein
VVIDGEHRTGQYEGKKGKSEKHEGRKQRGISAGDHHFPA